MGCYIGPLRESAYYCYFVPHKLPCRGVADKFAPAADTAVPLILFDAEITVRSLYSEKTYKLEDFIIGPGKTVLEKNEYVYSIKVKKQKKDQFSKFLKGSSGVSQT